MAMHYHFELLCPCCGKRSETTAPTRIPGPHVKCGDCLLERVEIVEFKVLSVTEVRS